MKKVLFVIAGLLTVAGALTAGCGGGGGGGRTASAKCNDGTLSYSQSCSGTCSSHGGVAEWYNGCGN